MQLTLTDTHLVIALSGWERLWSVHIDPKIEIPIAHIQQATTTAPETTWRELRAPGTYLPKVIKAGTYYTERGREFWHVTDKAKALCLDLSAADYYKRIVITIDQNRTWADRINHNCG